MSMMCNLSSSCKTTTGMCVHEKMMLTMIAMILAVVAGFWFLG